MAKAVKSKFANPNERKPENSFNKAVSSVLMFLYGARKYIMALPVAYYALRIAMYNSVHLPTEVGIFLQNNGNFLRMIDRGTAVVVPLAVTFGCLAMMMFSRKAMYAWAISIFSLALPLLILFSNIYPA